MLRLGAALAASILFTGIATFSAGAQTGSAGTGDTPRRGGNFTLGVYVGDPDTYDCHRTPSGAVMYRVAPHYSTLIKVDAGNYPNIVGDLADSWTVSPDGLTYTFKLHPNVKFHDGSPFSSADIRATYERIRNPPAGVVSLRRPLYGDIAAIDTPDANTVIFRLSKANAAMLSLLASPFNCVYSARRLAEDPKFPERNVMGTGPFKFTSYEPGGVWNGERFADYFRAGMPYLDGFNIPATAPAALLNAMAAGQILTEFRGLADSERERVVAQRGDKVRVLEAEQPGMVMITFNTTRAPFNDLRVRQAMNLAIDRWSGAEPMSKLAIFNRVGGFQRIGAPYGRTKEELQKLPGFRPDMAANRAEARRLLAEAGKANLTVTFLNRQNLTPLGVYLIDQWRQIGVTVNPDQPENARFLESRLNANFDMLIDALQDYIDEPSLQLSAFLSYDKNPTNIARAIDRKVDDLYAQQASSTDVVQRKRLVQELEAHLMDQAYTVPFYWVKRVIVLPTEVRNFHMNPSRLLGIDPSDIWLAQ